MTVDKAVLQAELDALNAAVDEAVRKRTEWMDAHMTEFTAFRVGDHIYDLKSGQSKGIITRLYRYHADRDWRYDTSMNIEAEFQTAPNNYDNTSRQPFALGTFEEARRRLEWNLNSLKWQSENKVAIREHLERMRN